ncbi:MAG: hypothetical protein V7637_2348 [Mycobacteriales bacterium]|jgi:hypothetical protein
MERPVARFWWSRRGRGGTGQPAGAVRTGLRAGEPPAEPVGTFWSAALQLAGARMVDLSYEIDPPLLIGAPLPRVAVRSVPAASAFSLDLRLPTPASLLYVGVLNYTDGHSRTGRARVAGTWSAPTSTFWGTWLGAARQRGTVRIMLRQH